MKTNGQDRRMGQTDRQTDTQTEKTDWTDNFPRRNIKYLAFTKIIAQVKDVWWLIQFLIQQFHGCINNAPQNVVIIYFRFSVIVGAPKRQNNVLFNCIRGNQCSEFNVTSSPPDGEFDKTSIIYPELFLEIVLTVFSPFQAVGHILVCLHSTLIDNRTMSMT